MRGRTPPPELLLEHIVPSTGRTIHIRKLSVFTRGAIRSGVIRANPEPEPPLVTIDYGDGQLREPNRGDPTYQRRLAEWRTRTNEQIAERLTELFLRRGIVVHDDEIDRAAVAQARADLAAVGADIQDLDDAQVYVRFVCIGPDEDWTDIQKLIWERSTPTEAAVQAQIATFRPDLPGQAAVSPEPGPAGGGGELQP